MVVEKWSFDAAIAGVLSFQCMMNVAQTYGRLMV